MKRIFEGASTKVTKDGALRGYKNPAAGRTMTRGSFELIAEVFKAEKGFASGSKDADAMWALLAVKMATALGNTNSAFDRKRFLKACGF